MNNIGSNLDGAKRTLSRLFLSERIVEDTILYAAIIRIILTGP